MKELTMIVGHLFSVIGTWATHHLLWVGIAILILALVAISGSWRLR
jgi:hypothetical protein